MTRSLPRNLGSHRGEKARQENRRALPTQCWEEPGRREPLPAGRRGSGTDLHSPAGVRPKFGHSLEHIVLRKKPPPPPPPRKETEARGGRRSPQRPRSSCADPGGGFLAEGRRVTDAREDQEPPITRPGRCPRSPFSPARVGHGTGGAVATPCAGAASARSLRTRRAAALRLCGLW